MPDFNFELAGARTLVRGSSIVLSGLAEIVEDCKGTGFISAINLPTGVTATFPGLPVKNGKPYVYLGSAGGTSRFQVRLAAAESTAAVPFVLKVAINLNGLEKSA